MVKEGREDRGRVRGCLSAAHDLNARTRAPYSLDQTTNRVECDMPRFDRTTSYGLIKIVTCNHVCMRT